MRKERNGGGGLGKLGEEAREILLYLQNSPDFHGRVRHSSRAAPRRLSRTADSYVVCTAFVHSFFQVFSNGSPIARSFGWRDPMERAGGARGGISGLYGLDGGRASVCSVRPGMRNERTKKQMLTLDAKFLAIVGEAIQSKEGFVCVWHLQCHIS